MSKSIVITGASTGIGRATALYFAENGWNVAATMRTPEKETELQTIENISVYQLDVTSLESVEAAYQAITADFDKVDVVLNNAGYGLMGAFELAGREEVKRQFDVNVIGLFDVTRTFLPHFRANGDGLFINISSVGGKMTFPYMSLYHSTKWAVEGFTESLNYELSQLGIKARIVEPGGVATDFGGRSLSVATSEEVLDYNAGFAKFQESFSEGGLNMSQPVDIAKVIYEAATDESDRVRYIAGDDAKMLIGNRNEVGDETFIATMSKQWF